MRVRRLGHIVDFSRNGAVFYTAPQCSSGGPLFFSTSAAGPGILIKKPRISCNVHPPPVEHVGDPFIVLSTTAFPEVAAWQQEPPNPDPTGMLTKADGSGWNGFIASKEFITGDGCATSLSASFVPFSLFSSFLLSLCYLPCFQSCYCLLSLLLLFAVSAVSAVTVCCRCCYCLLSLLSGTYPSAAVPAV